MTSDKELYYFHKIKEMFEENDREDYVPLAKLLFIHNFIPYLHQRLAMKLNFRMIVTFTIYYSAKQVLIKCLINKIFSLNHGENCLKFYQ